MSATVVHSASRTRESRSDKLIPRSLKRLSKSTVFSTSKDISNISIMLKMASVSKDTVFEDAV